jgi:hypothetical protein
LLARSSIPTCSARPVRGLRRHQSRRGRGVTYWSPGVVHARERERDEQDPGEAGANAAATRSRGLWIAQSFAYELDRPKEVLDLPAARCRELDPLA